MVNERVLAAAAATIGFLTTLGIDAWRDTRHWSDSMPIDPPAAALAKTDAKIIRNSATLPAAPLSGDTLNADNPIVP